MLKRFFLIVLFAFLFVLPSNAALDTDKTYYTRNPLIVRNAPPEANTHSRAVAILPEKTTVRIVHSVSEDIGKWYQIEWYSDVDKIHKTACVAYPVLAVNVSNITDEERIAASDIIENAILERTDFNTLDYYKKYEKYDDAIEMLNKRLYSLFIVSDFSVKMRNSTLQEDVEAKQHLADIISSTFGLRAAVYALKNKYSLALSDFDESIFYKNDDYTVHNAKAVLLFRQGYYSKAKASFLKARTLAAKAGNEKSVIEINGYISRIERELAKLK